MTGPAWTLPRVVFVLGKGGVGRSSIAAAMGLAAARRGERALIFGWTASDPVAPWFGARPAGLMPSLVAPRVHVGNYRLEDTLKLYFVEHLKLPRFYRYVINGVHVRKLIEAAPGIAEVFFVGHLWWLSTLAATEAGLEFDRIIVDAPATGHGASLLDLPDVLSSLDAKGLLAVERDRVVTMLKDPAWTGAVVVTLPEELACEETVELVPRVAQRLGRPPLAVLVNRSVAGILEDGPRPPWRMELGSHLSASAREGLDVVYSDLRGRLQYERALREVLAGNTVNGVQSLREQWMCEGSHGPLDVARRLAGELESLTGGRA